MEGALERMLKFLRVRGMGVRVYGHHWVYEVGVSFVVDGFGGFLGAFIGVFEGDWEIWSWSS